MTGNELRKLRQKLGMNQEQFAEVLDWSKNTLYRREALEEEELPKVEAMGILAVAQRIYADRDGSKSSDGGRLEILKGKS